MSVLGSVSSVGQRLEGFCVKAFTHAEPAFAWLWRPRKSQRLRGFGARRAPHSQAFEIIFILGAKVSILSFNIGSDSWTLETTNKRNPDLKSQGEILAAQMPHAFWDEIVLETRAFVVWSSRSGKRVY